jgi:hypothetical protein
MPYGDQCLFMQRHIFEILGPFRSLPFMEDYEFIIESRNIVKIITLNSSIQTSARRWEMFGAFENTVINQVNLDKK